MVIAVAKWLGTLAPTVQFGLASGRGFVLGVGLLCSVLDLAYIALLPYARRRAAGRHRDGAPPLPRRKPERKPRDHWRPWIDRKRSALTGMEPPPGLGSGAVLPCVRGIARGTLMGGLVIGTLGGT